MTIHNGAMRGPRGVRGFRDRTGKPGATGPGGPAGTQTDGADVLARVDEQFRDVRRQLETQLLRMAQIQEQIDRIQGVVEHVMQRDGTAGRKS